MFSQLSALRSLHIGVLSIGEDIDIVTAQIRSLSPNLEELDLSFYRANQILLRATPSPNIAVTISRFWNKLTKFQEVPNNDTTPSSSVCWSVAERFPRLIKLRLACHLSGYTWPPIAVSLSEEDAFGTLPETLEYLEWSGLRLIELIPQIPSRVNDYSLLPRGLKSLSLGGPSTEPISIDTPASAKTLPPKLTRLTNRVIHADTIAALPRTLTEGYWLPSHSSTAVADILAAVPPLVHTMEDLDVSVLSVTYHRWPQLLPQFLTTFSVRKHPFTANEIELLPRTIINLHYLEIDVQSFKNRFVDPEAAHSLWPPALRHIRFVYESGLQSVENIRFLPPTLHNINGLEVKDVLDMLGTCFPELLRFGSVSHVPAISITYPLPATLKQLVLYTHRVEPESFKMMPHGLTILELVSTPFTKQETALSLGLLPSTIVTLRVEGLHCSAFSVLPASLRHLHTPTLTGEIPEDLPSYVHLPSADPHDIAKNSRGRQWF